MRDLDLRDPRVLEGSLVVSASAGSGKTFTLTALVAAELGRGALRPWEILATTFSEASAADLRARLLRPLDLLAALDEAAWADLLPALEAEDLAAVEARLRTLPLPEALRKPIGEVGLAACHWRRAPWTASPARARTWWRRLRREAALFRVATIHSLALSVLGRGEGRMGTLLDTAHPALLRLLRQTAREALTLPGGHPDAVVARRLLAWCEGSWEALSQALDGHLDARGHLRAEASTASRAALEVALEAARKALAPFAADPQRACESTSPQRRHFKPGKILPLPPEGADLAARLRWAESQGQRFDKLDVGYLTAEFKQAMGALQPVADALEAWMRGLLVDALARFEARKREQELATFGDLVREALASLEARPLEGPAPRLLLVDESQDTSQAQDAFLAALGAERTVRVGDVKQAIYGFRGGDPELLRGHLAQAGEGAFRLPANFRSTPEVVALANRFVDEVWPALDPAAGDLDGTQRAVLPPGGPVGLVRAPAPPRGADLPGLADWIAALSREGGWARALGPDGPETLGPDGPETLGPDGPETLGSAGPGRRRRALLLKQRTRLPILLQRLKARGIQPYVVAQSGFWESPGVRLVMAALEAVAHPERPLPFAALLRQVAGLTDAELSELARTREGRASLPGLGALRAEQVPEPRREAVESLLALRDLDTQAIAGHLLRQGALLQAVAALRVHGSLEPLRARRNLAALLSRLLALPASPSVAYGLLDDERQGQERGDLPAQAEDADLIIQTAHASKGLEYEDVILPLLNQAPRAFRKGDLSTEPATGALRFAWKLGRHEGAAYRALKPEAKARRRRDDLNLLYVALTRAQRRLCLLLQAPAGLKPPSEADTWAQWGQHLAEAHEALKPLAAPPALAPAEAAPLPPPEPPPRRAPLDAVPPEAHDGLSARARSQARQDGEAMHGFLRDLLVRWEDAGAFAACLAAPPPVSRAREQALRFLEAFEARGWRSLRRRTELPLAGAAASGGTGRADLVVWAEERLHLLDFKHSAAFGEAELAGYREQLRRYAAALEAREGLPVTTWLVPLRGDGRWVEVAPVLPQAGNRKA
ncbi:MAG: UvrD-helicase domain-containing protein [Holophagaceae bacterium]